MINIITSKPGSNGIVVRSNVSGGTESTRNANAYIGYQLNKLSVSISGNTQLRDRFDDLYYDWIHNDYDRIENITSVTQPYEKLIDRPGVSYSKPYRAINRQGVNTYLKYSVSGQTNFEINSGYQNSDVQKIYVNNNATPFTQNSSQSRYLDFKGHSHGFHGQFSFLSGNQDINEPLWDYDYTTMDTNLEYEWKYKKLELRPGFSRRYADYDGDFVGDKALLNSTSLSLLSNYNATLKHRLIAGLRIDKYDFSDRYHTTYEIGTTIRVNKNNLLRLVHSRAVRSPFMVDTFMDIEQQQGGETVRYYGNKNKDLLTAYTFEAGWSEKCAIRFANRHRTVYFNVK